MTPERDEQLRAYAQEVAEKLWLICQNEDELEYVLYVLLERMMMRFMN